MEYSSGQSRKARVIQRTPNKSTATVAPVNRAGQSEIRHILGGTGIQAKVTVGAPNDKYEQEADRVAEEVMRMPDEMVQRQEEPEEEEEEVQRMPNDSWSPPMIQRLCPECEAEQGEGVVQADSETGAFEPSQEVSSKIQSIRGGGQSLPSQELDYFEPRFGVDLSKTRIHTDSRANMLARSVNARAFTMGENVVFGTGQYSPGTAKGRHLMAHELVHVIQQGGGQSLQRKVSQDRRLINTKNQKPLIIRRTTEGAVTGGVIGAAAGAVIGGIAGGPVGAIIGGVVGGGIGAGVGALVSGSKQAASANTTWSVSGILAMLCNPQDRWVIDRIVADHIVIMAFHDAIDRWRDNATGVETDVSLANSLRGNTDRSGRTIRLNERLSTQQAAITLYHEMNHWIRPSSATRAAYLQQEIDVRVATEQFLIRHGLPATKPSYRTSSGQVDVAAITADVNSSTHYNPTTRTRVGRTYVGERAVSGWRCP